MDTSNCAVEFPILFYHYPFGTFDLCFMIFGKKFLRFGTLAF